METRFAEPSQVFLFLEKPERKMCSLGFAVFTAEKQTRLVREVDKMAGISPSRGPERREKKGHKCVRSNLLNHKRVRYLPGDRRYPRQGRGQRYTPEGRTE